MSITANAACVIRLGLTVNPATNAAPSSAVTNAAPTPETSLSFVTVRTPPVLACANAARRGSEPSA
jgi:hypothetical protein